MYPFQNENNTNAMTTQPNPERATDTAALSSSAQADDMTPALGLSTIPPTRQPDEKQTQKKARTLSFPLLAICMLIAFIGGFVGRTVFVTLSPGTQMRPIYYRQPAATAEPEPDSWSGTVALIQNSVVELQIQKTENTRGYAYIVPDQYASGVILSEDGYLITNAHVVTPATIVKVILSNGSDYEAQVVATDAKTDIAILKIDASNLMPVKIGNSDLARVGDKILAVGNPTGQLGGTVTTGLISAISRDVIVEGYPMQLMQFSAAINDGSSGGGLFSAAGELVGIVSGAISDAEGLHFAVPVNVATHVTEELLQKGYVSGRPALGVTLLEVQTVAAANKFGLSRYGVYVYEVQPGTSAAQQGLLPFDYVVALNGQPIEYFWQVADMVDACKIGDTVKLEVLRGETPYTFMITLGERGGD